VHCKFGDCEGGGVGGRCAFGRKSSERCGTLGFFFLVSVLKWREGFYVPPTSGPCQRPPPPVRHCSSTTPLSSPLSFVAVALSRHPSPSNRRRYVCLAESSRLTAVAVSALPSSHSSPLLRSSGVLLLPSLPLSSSASPPSGREKRPRQLKCFVPGCVI
jgi:hypothetical protein